MSEKKQLRKEMKQLIASQSSDAKRDTSERIGMILKKWIEKNAIQHIGVYIAQPDEIDLSAFIQFCLSENKSLYAPIYQHEQSAYQFAPFDNLNHLSRGKFSIPEPTKNPISLEEIQLILVPGLAFDLHGNRLGRGGGYYDRILKEFNGISIGISAPFQLRSHIPTDVWDQTVDYICGDAERLKFCKDH